MNVKQPFIWSTSEYNDPAVNVKDSAIPVAAALCRASIGTPYWMGGDKYATDKSFPHYWPQWGVARLPRCAYGFSLNANPKAPTYSDQAKQFVKCLNAAGGWKIGDRIGVDCEEGENLSAKAILDWFTQVNVLIPALQYDRDFLIYSRANILNPLNFDKAGLTPAQRAYLLAIPTWTAGYPDNPDTLDFPALKKTYQADPARFGKCVIVQYAAAATVQGLSKPNYLSVECNVADPEYLAKWQEETAAYYSNQPNPPGNGGTPPMYNYEITPAVSSAVNVRADHFATSTDIGDLNVGKVARGNDLWTDVTGQEKWLHILELDGQPKDGWVAVLHNGSPITKLTALQPPVSDVAVLSATLTMPDGKQYGADNIQLTPKP